MAVSCHKQFADFANEGVATRARAALQLGRFQAIAWAFFRELPTLLVASATIKREEPCRLNGHGRSASPCFVGKIEKSTFLILKIRLISVEGEGGVGKKVRPVAPGMVAHRTDFEGGWRATVVGLLFCVHKSEILVLIIIEIAS